MMNFDEKLRDALHARAGDVDTSNSEVEGLQHKATVARPGGSSLPKAALLAAAAIVIAFASGALMRPTGGGPLDAAQSASQQPRDGASPDDSFRSIQTNGPGYSKSDQVASLEAARAIVPFDIVAPNSEWANPSNLQGVYVLADQAVAMIYPPPAKPESYLRQPYIEVYQSPWDVSKDPREWYEKMIEQDPNPDTSIIEIEGLPALIVTAHSKADDEQANPAFLRIAVNGVEIQVSGGESIERIQDIAAGLVKDALRA